METITLITDKGSLVINEGAGTVKLGEKTVWLTGFELSIIRTLAIRAGEIVSKAEIEKQLYGEGPRDKATTSNVVEVLVGKIRRKFENRSLIATERGRGYGLMATKVEEQKVAA